MQAHVHRLIVLALAGGIPATSGAAVTDVAPNGFTVTIETHIKAKPEAVYASLIKPERWWASDHTFSGSAANLHLDPKAGGCWCETLPNGGAVQHLTVVYAAPGKALRMRGALGPFQSLAVDGALTFALKTAQDGTDLTVTYTLGGYNKDGFEQLSHAADEVLSTQVERLKSLIEAGPGKP